MSEWVYNDPAPHTTWYTPPAALDPHGRLLQGSGYAAFVGGYVPYIPMQLVDVDAIVARFAHCLETLSGLSARFTLELRIFARPGLPPNQPALQILVLGKAIGDTQAEAQDAGEMFWRLLERAFPSEPPFLFPLERVSAHELEEQQRVLRNTTRVVGLRKHQDGDGPDRVTAFPHPFRMFATSHTLMSLYAALAGTPVPLVLSISLRPSGLPDSAYIERLFAEFAPDGDQRIQAEELARRYRAESSADARTSLIDTEALARRRLEHEARRRVNRARELGREHARRDLAAFVCEQFVRQRDRLLSMHVYLASFAGQVPPAAVQAVRAALAAPPLAADAPLYFSPPDVIDIDRVDQYGPDAAAIARSNLAQMEHQIPTHAGQGLQLCYTVTPEEASALFCLPSSSGFGEVPGVVVRDEPFVLPLEPHEDRKVRAAPPSQEPQIEIGTVYHRGIRTALPATIPLSRLDQHMLIAGRSGSGKTNTCLYLLSQLWAAGIPFLVLDPLMKHDYRLLLGDKQLKDHLHIYTLGDSTTSPFTFNPFAVPPNVGVREHISQLLRCFVNAFATGDPLPSIYRAALQQAYLAADSRWDLDTDRGGMERRVPTFASFYEVLLRIAEQRSKEYGAETRGNIRQMTRNRIGSLLEDNYRLLNTLPDDERDPFATIPNRPVIIEVARIGSDEDKALIMSFLLACLVPRMQHRPERQLHMTLIEEAHRLMRGQPTGHQQHRGDSTNQASMEFANLLAEMRGFKQGIIVVDQSPAELVPAVLSNTATRVMHQVRDPASFEIMANTFVLDEAQRTYARRLLTGHAVTETSHGLPMHIVVPNYVGSLTNGLSEAMLDDESYLDENGIVRDTVVQALMQKHPTSMPAFVKPADPFAVAPAASSDVPYDTHHKQAAPLLTCVHCRPYLKHGVCPYQRVVQPLRAEGGLKKRMDQAVSNGAQQRKSQLSIKHLQPELQQLKQELPVSEQEFADAAYCYVAHSCNAVLVYWIQKGNSASERPLTPYINLLKTFHKEPET